MHATCSLFLAQVTSKDSFVAAFNDVMDIDHPTKPRMPWIKHLYGFGHMGFATLACTTASGCTKPWVTAPRARSSRKRYGLPSFGAGETPLALIAS
jgi:hypothetical protein